jgi:programmed cell death 6-interacting protein
LSAFDDDGFQYAAGTLSFLKSSALPKLVFSPDDEEIPMDLSDAFVQGLEWLMLAQAQECSWQMAKLSMSALVFKSLGSAHNISDQYKNGLISKVAARVRLTASVRSFELNEHPALLQTASLYQSAATTIRNALPPIKHLFPSVCSPCVSTLSLFHSNKPLGLASPY